MAFPAALKWLSSTADIGKVLFAPTMEVLVELVEFLRSLYRFRHIFSAILAALLALVPVTGHG